MKPTTGFFWTLYFWRYSAASSSIEPPISPIKTIPARRGAKEERGRRVSLLLLDYSKSIPPPLHAAAQRSMGESE